MKCDGQCYQLKSYTGFPFQLLNTLHGSHSQVEGDSTYNSEMAHSHNLPIIQSTIVTLNPHTGINYIVGV